MKKALLWCIPASFLLCFSIAPPLQGSIEISYFLEDLGDLEASRWKATYEVFNSDGSLEVNWLTVYFDYGFYDDLLIETPSPLADHWDENFQNPQFFDPLPVRGFYDLEARSGGIGPGQSLTGFAVSFGWLGEGVPDRPQYFEIFDNSFNVLSDGYAIYIPEPATLLLLAVGTCLTSRRIRRRR